MGRLSIEQRGQAVGMLQAGKSQHEVARQMGCSQAAISKLMSKFGRTGTVKDLARPGRPPVTTHDQDRRIVLKHLQNRFKTARTTAAETSGTKE